MKKKKVLLKLVIGMIVVAGFMIWDMWNEKNRDYNLVKKVFKLDLKSKEVKEVMLLENMLDEHRHLKLKVRMSEEDALKYAEKLIESDKEHDYKEEGDKKTDILREIRQIFAYSEDSLLVYKYCPAEKLYYDGDLHCILTKIICVKKLVDGDCIVCLFFTQWSVPNTIISIMDIM